MVGHYERLLAALVANPHGQISAAAMLSEAERWRWAESNGADYQPESSLQEMFERQVRRTRSGGGGSRAATVELWGVEPAGESTGALSGEARVGPETLVGICMERSGDGGGAAVLKAGVRICRWTRGHLRRESFMLADAGVKVVLTQSELRAVVRSGGVEVILVDGEWEAIGRGE